VIVIIIICCCCRRCRKAKLEKERLLDEYAEMEYYRGKSLEETAPKTTARRRELEQKYGLRPR